MPIAIGSLIWLPVISLFKAFKLPVFPFIWMPECPPLIMLFWILVLLVLFPMVAIAVPATIPFINVLGVLIGRLMVLLEMVLLSAALINCTPQPVVAVASRMITKLFSFTNLAPSKTTTPGFTPGKAITLLPEPSKVTVLVALAFGIF